MEDKSKCEILLYQADGNTHIEVKMVDETVWLTQQQMAELFQTSRTNVAGHFANVGKIVQNEAVTKCNTLKL